MLHIDPKAMLNDDSDTLYTVQFVQPPAVMSDCWRIQCPTDKINVFIYIIIQIHTGYFHSQSSIHFSKH